jgi:hypothetical protein
MKLVSNNMRVDVLDCGGPPAMLSVERGDAVNIPSRKVELVNTKLENPVIVAAPVNTETYVDVPFPVIAAANTLFDQKRNVRTANTETLTDTMVVFIIK